ncbi:hypothetical protein LXA43DRAFT_210652 [Ganoderma leucocontextum]|nr:hypothetical protein LXA43DRAFT_210652 [Ganoderma leucocontextum]
MAHAAVLAEKEEFCDAYFPIPSSPSPNKPKPVLETNPFLELKDFKGNEAKLRTAFAKIVDDHNLVPGLVFRECSERPDPLYIDPYQQKVDAAWCFERDAKDDKTQDWGNQVLPVEFKAVDDPFDDTQDNISTSAGKRKMARGQIITYSERLHAVQQRTALFMLIVIGQRARFTRWDRSGTVVTRAFNYVKDWKFFCDILWRIGNCSSAQLGLDPTATHVYDSDPDYVTMFKAANMENTVDHAERVLKDGKLPEGEFEYVRKMFKASLKPNWPRYRVEVPDGEGCRKFLIGKPAFLAKGMAGRGTRGYVALDCATGRFVWLKDAWRANYELVDQEGDILKALNQAKVYNVPTMICHGDIEGQATETPDWWERKKQEREQQKREQLEREQLERDQLERENQAREKPRRDRTTPASSSTDSSDTCVNSSSSRPMKRKLKDDGEASTEPAAEAEHSSLRLHQHYRLVVQEVAMPLDHFQYPQQLVAIMFDCVRSHYEAATKPKRPLLHRDISSGNILIYPRVIVTTAGGAELQWRGILVDWEMSKPKHKGEGLRTARQPERTGTWQYLSMALLAPGLIQVGIPDELESFFHVFLHYALRYIKSTNSNGLAIANFLDQYFDLYGYEDGVYTCGALKRSTIELGRIRVGTSTYLRFGNPLDTIFAKLLSWFRARYIVLAYKKQQAAAEHEPEASTGSDADPSRSSSVPRHIDYGMDSFAAQLAAPEPDSMNESVEVPTAEQTALAERLQAHDQMLQLLLKAMGEIWPPQEAADQIPSGWKPPSGSRFPLPLSKTVENKRKRIKKAAGCVSEPPPPLRPLVTPRSPHTPQRRTANSLGFLPEDESS